jgi:hypothetical protein
LHCLRDIRHGGATIGGLAHVMGCRDRLSRVREGKAGRLQRGDERVVGAIGARGYAHADDDGKACQGRE